MSAQFLFPGCHIIPGLLNDLEQQNLFMEALTVFPEPPNRSNLTAQHGRLPSLWAAAQQGLFLQSRDKSTSGQSNAHTGTFADRQKPLTQGLPPKKPPMSSTAATCCPSISNLSSVPNQQQNVGTQSKGRSNDFSAATTRSTDVDSSSSQQQSQTSCTQEPIVQQGRWQSAPGGPSATSLLHKLRWVALGPQFNWTTRQYEYEPGVKPLPAQLICLAQHVVNACQEVHLKRQHIVDLASFEDGSMQAVAPEHEQHASNACRPCQGDNRHPRYEPDTALVNFYREGDTLGGHKDDAEEQADCPIVSLSLGCDAVFLIGGATKDVVPTAVWIHSGDAVVLSGPARQSYHGVPRVLPGRTTFQITSPACANEVAACMQTTRVNISIRQQ